MINQDSTSADSMAERRAHLQALAESADRGEIDSSPDQLPSATQGNETAETDNGEGNRASELADKADRTSDSSEPSAEQARPEGFPDKGAQPRGPDGKFSKKEQPTDKQPAAPTPTGEAAPVEKPESAFSRAKKDEARLARNRQEFETEKQQFRSEVAEFRRQMQELKQPQAQQSAQSGPQLSSQQFSAASKVFEKQAAELFREGNIAEAEAKLDLRDKALAAAEQGRQEEARTEQERFDATWRNTMHESIQQNQELADPNSEAGTAMRELLQELPILYSIPDGFKQGVELLKLRKTAAESSGLKDENQQLKSRVAFLESKLAPEDVRSTSKHTAPSGFAEMTTAQKREYLQAKAEEADQQAA